MGTHQFVYVGPDKLTIEGEIPVVVTDGVVGPQVRTKKTINNDGFLTDLKSSMYLRGWAYETALAPEAPTLKQIRRAKLNADAAGIFGTTFATVLSVSLASRGGTVLQARTSLIAGVLIGGTTRLVINGGAFSNQVLIVSNHAVLTNAPGGGDSYVDLPVTATDTTYTVRVECASSIAGSITPRAGSSIVVEEYA